MNPPKFANVIGNLAYIPSLNRVQKIHSNIKHIKVKKYPIITVYFFFILSPQYINLKDLQH
jgi:hypothetical protein